jgi:phospholipid/cholesterol/gamma-HCH transport system permease protein
MKSMNREMTNERVPIENSLRFFQSPGGPLIIQLKGDWRMEKQLPSVKEVENQLAAEARVEQVGFDTSGLTAWDSGLLTFVIKIRDLSTKKEIQFNSEGLPE